MVTAAEMLSIAAFEENRLARKRSKLRFRADRRTVVACCSASTTRKSGCAAVVVQPDALIIRTRRC